MVDKGSTIEEVAGELQRRVLAGESDLHEAQTVINSLGAAPSGAPVVRRLITQDILTSMHARR